MGEIERISAIAPESPLVSQVSHFQDRAPKKHDPERDDESTMHTNDTVEINGELAETEPKEPINPENTLDIAA